MPRFTYAMFTSADFNEYESECRNDPSHERQVRRRSPQMAQFAASDNRNVKAGEYTIDELYDQIREYGQQIVDLANDTDVHNDDLCDLTQTVEAFARIARDLVDRNENHVIIWYK